MFKYNKITAFWAAGVAASLFGGPALAADETIVVTAGYDILRDQGRALADRLKAEGVPVIYRNYGSLTHGFMQHSGTIDDAETACVETAQLIGTGLRGHYRGAWY